MRELDRRVMADDQLNPAESYAWRKWRGFLSSEPRKERREEEKTSSCSSASTRSSTSCDHQRQVLAVQGAPVPIHRQSGGHSCFMSMDLADPVSSGKYSGNVRVHSSSWEPIVMSFTVLEWLYHRRHCSCRDPVLFVGRLPCLCGPNVLRGCLRRDVVWWWRFHS